MGVVVLDLVLAWTGNAVGWFRQFARLLTTGTVAANVSAGWPSPLAIGLHAAAPLMLLVMVEAARTVLLRRIGIAAGTVRDRIPFGRWILSPWRTFLLWRRMVLWQITSYRDVLDMKARLRRAHIQLRNHFGPHWRRAAPADLLWMLNTAPFAHKACQAVDELTNEPGEPVVDLPAPSEPADGISADQLDDAIRVNERHWVQHGRPASSETVRKQLGIGAARARELTWISAPWTRRRSVVKRRKSRERRRADEGLERPS